MLTMRVELSIIVLMSCAGICFAQTKPATTRAAEDVDEVKLHVGNETEYKSLFELPGITPEQTTALKEKIAERQRVLAGWVESDKGRELIRIRTELAAARREKKTKLISPLRKQALPLSEEYFKVRTAGRMEILNLLTPEQQQRYAARAIQARALRDLGKIKITEAQRQQFDTMCFDAAAEHLKANPLETDPYFNKSEPVVGKVSAELRAMLKETAKP